MQETWNGRERRREPGSLSLDERLKRIETALSEIDRKVDGQSNLVWKVIGVAAGVSAVIGISGDFILRALHL